MSSACRPRSPNLREERKGPRVGAPDAAIQGFLKSAGLERIEDARIETDPKKGEFYVAVIEKPGRETKDAHRGDRARDRPSFPWPKSMRWGAASPGPTPCAGCGRCAASSARSQPSTRRPRSCRSKSTGSQSGDVTFGHRFMAPGPIQVRRFDDYVERAAEGQGRARRGAAQGDHPRRRQQSRLRAGARRSSRTRVFWRKSPGWSNGRSC